MLPEFLYKYRTWECEYNKVLLTKNEIFLSSANLFNDPFDCEVTVKYDNLSKAEVIKRNIDYLKKVQPELKRKERRTLARKQEKLKFYKDPDHIKWFDQYKKDYNDNFGIYSLTSDCENIVMWSHYANSHKGFCVGFETKKLNESFKIIFNQTGLIIDLYKVEYQKEYPKLMIQDFEKNDPEELIIKPLIIKSEYWKYEKEYRLILTNNVNLPVQLYEGIIIKVILGCKMPDKHKDEIINILNKKRFKIELFEAKQSSDSFGLTFSHIAY